MKIDKTISCIIIDDELIAREVIQAHLSKIPTVKVVGNFSNAMDAFNFLLEDTVDLIFLDINMPEISGISFAKSINEKIKIIFTTAYRDYAVEGFELQAVDYLLKPISFDRLLKAVSNFFEISSRLHADDKLIVERNDFMFVRSDRKMLKVDFDLIHYIESYSDYLKIHLTDKTIVTRMTISAVEAKLPSEKFLRIHRSFIIAISSISSFTNEEIVVNKEHLPISRSYKKEVLNTLEKF